MREFRIGSGRVIPVLLLLLGGLSACDGAPDTAVPSALDVDAVVTLQNRLDEARRQADVPGMGAVISRSSGLVAHAVSGQRRIDHGANIEPDDAFHIGSVTKTMTGMLAAQAVETGQLGWDTRLLDVFPEFRDNALPDYEGLTLAHLLSHESGLPQLIEDDRIAVLPAFTGSLQEQRQALVGWMLLQPPVGEAGASYHYSNGGFTAAAAMIERRTGTSWEQAIKDQIASPLGMQHVGLGWPGTGAGAEGFVFGHRRENGQWRPVDPDGDYQIAALLNPAGALHASMSDMGIYGASWLQAMLGQSESISQATVDAMLEPRFQGGISWGVQRGFGHEQAVVYVGSAGTFVCFIVLIPEGDLAVTVVMNGTDDSSDRAAVRLLQTLIDDFS
ncbi:serine hydrolase domain-containing protein [Natronospira bacteriovora]|uniref:Serine hydrolase domain-containing protein n=1 Tax=Natronospira bacteriovora TaxID=3069753 RepID=A0ABU0W4S5_9GAMM|nr:serine hydrolase domain-containing protein [Natronospira sp. AB-CW4]MDQ2069020.1 serine hydrolase domain-containing protein [Natronospira sp. AB-CW4]